MFYQLLWHWTAGQPALKQTNKQNQKAVKNYGYPAFVI